jgi:hypothetical protein
MTKSSGLGLRGCCQTVASLFEEQKVRLKSTLAHIQVTSSNHKEHIRHEPWFLNNSSRKLPLLNISTFIKV